VTHRIIAKLGGKGRHGRESTPAVAEMKRRAYQKVSSKGVEQERYISAGGVCGRRTLGKQQVEGKGGHSI